MGKLEGKVAIVVGSTAGIGQAIAERFAKEGATVIVTGRRDEIGKAVVDEITKAGGKAEFYKLDAKNINACYNLIDTVTDKYGKLDILEYNAGIANIGDHTKTIVGNITEDVWDAIFDINLKSAFFMTQKALPELIKTKGNVIYTSSIGGLSAVNSKTNLPYGGTKAAINYITRNIALNVADKGVRINAVAPGLTETNILADSQPEEIENLRESIPMKRISSVEDIANGVLFLASEEAQAVTGQVFSICGGMCIS